MQTILILDDDRETTEALAGLLEEPGRTLVLCGDIESAEIVVERGAPDFVLTDLRFAGPFAYEGLGFVHFVRRHAPHCRIVVVTGVRAEGLECEARRCGADALLYKPLCRGALEAQLRGCVPAGDGVAVRRIPSIDEVIASDRPIPNYQPIIDPRSEERPIHGFESLARFDDPLLSDPLTLFDYAQRKGRLVDLELVCVQASFAGATRLASTSRL